MNFESDSTTSRLVARVEKNLNRLDALGIEHGEILDRPYGSGLAFRDPDNIQLEFFLPMGS